MKKIVGALLLAVGCVASFGASAAVYVYDFGDKIVGGGPAQASFAELVFDDVSNRFTLTIDKSFSSIFGENAFISTVAVDYSGTQPGVSSMVAGGGVASVGTSSGGGPGGNFDFRFVLGGGKDRLTAGESVSWFSAPMTDKHGVISAFNPTQAQFVALHVQGLEDGNSGWYGDAVTTVPEPEAYLLMFSGLGLIGISLRRKA